jgi:quinol monooxygenase YgiN
MIRLIATIELAAGRRHDFLAIFRLLVPKVRAEEGCLEYLPAIDLATSIAAQGPVRDNVVTVIEAWESVEALEKHLATPHMLEYRRAVKDLVRGVQLQVLEPA